MKCITIEPITRLEGEGKISIFLDEKGDVKEAYWQIVEIRGFEKFCIGRPAEEMPRIVTRLCGVCPGAHHMASAKAVDALFGVDTIPIAAKKIREIFYHAHMLHSHIAHFYALAAPDFVLGPDAPPEKRNIFGLIEKVGLDTGKKVILARKYAQEIQRMIGGKATHSVFALPGGISKHLTMEEVAEMRKMAEFILEIAKMTQEIFKDVVLRNEKYMDIVIGGIYTHPTYYMSVVDNANKINFYEGDVRVVAPNGEEFVKFKPEDYLKHIEEHVEPWSYMKFPYLKKIGWKGFISGENSGIYRVAPLARLNASEGFTTPLAQKEYDEFYSILGEKPIHHTLCMHWARIIEMLYSAESLLELLSSPEILDRHVRNIPSEVVGKGVGIVEAPRGTLIHHYECNENGIITKVNLIVATQQNNSSINIDIKKCARNFIKNGKVNDGILNMIEMAFRAYDPCLACGTHTLPGQLSVSLKIYDSNGKLIKVVRRYKQ